MRFFNTTGPRRCRGPLLRPRRWSAWTSTRYSVSSATSATSCCTHRGRRARPPPCWRLRDLLNGSGDYRCVYANFEGGQAMREDVGAAMRTILFELEMDARSTLGDESLAEFWPGHPGTSRSGRCAPGCAGPLGGGRPEATGAADRRDRCAGGRLAAVGAAQLRAGYVRRPGGFPQSVVLCGVRDVRDYRIHSRSGNEVITGGSALQHQGPVAASGRLLAERGAGAARAAPRRRPDRRSPGGAGGGVGALPGPAVAGERAGRRGLLPQPGGSRPRPLGERGRTSSRRRRQLIVRRETHLDQLADKLREESGAARRPSRC